MQPNRRILIVDDQQDLREQLAKLLLRSGKTNETSSLVQGMRARLGRKDAPDAPSAAKSVFDIEYEVDIAAQGEEAFEMVRKGQAEGRPYAMMFTDMRMPPGWDGMETARRIREIDRSIEIVIMTAFADHDQREVAETIGLPHKLLYIKKPFQSEEIFQLALALTSKWNFEETERIRKEWLETLLRCMSKVKTINAGSINDIYSTILKAMLSFTGATQGFIASWTAGGDWDLRDAAGLEWSDAQTFIQQNIERLRNSRTTQQFDGKYILPLKRETFSAVVCVYDVANQSDPEWYKMISLLVMTSSEVLCNSVMSNTAVKKVQLNHLDQAVKKMTAMELDLLNRLETAAEAVLRGNPDHPDARQIRDEIVKGKSRVNYIREIMAIVGQDAGEFVWEEIMPAELARTVSEKVAQRFSQCKLNLNISGDEALKIKIAVEPFARVIETLMTNSCEASLNAGRTELVIDIDLREQKNSICLRYNDNGPGIPEELHESVFDPFAAKENDKVGIGLAASRIIMEKLMGGLFFDLNYRNGACFNIKLVKPQQ